MQSFARWWNNRLWHTSNKWQWRAPHTHFFYSLSECTALKVLQTCPPLNTKTKQTHIRATFTCNLTLRDPKADAMIPNVVCSGLRDHSIASTLGGERTKTQLLTQRKPTCTLWKIINTVGPFKRTMMQNCSGVSDFLLLMQLCIPTSLLLLIHW